MCKEKERMELSHEAQPGYPVVFVIAIIIAITYLGIIFFTPLFQAGGH